jgi:hypothetical protein
VGPQEGSGDAWLVLRHETGVEWGKARGPLDRIMALATEATRIGLVALVYDGPILLCALLRPAGRRNLVDGQVDSGVARAVSVSLGEADPWEEVRQHPGPVRS